MTQENPIWLQNLDYSARLDRQLVKAMFSEGVIDGLRVSEKSGGTDMSVDVAAGSAVIYGDDQVNQGAYLVHTTVSENHAISPAPGSNSRIDIVIYRVNDSNAGSAATPADVSRIEVIAGTPAATPTPPATPNTAIVIAEVLVASGTVSITNSLITNRRTPALQTGGLVPGSLVPFSGPATNIPPSFSLADGDELDREAEFRLFSFIGTTHGAGNGTTTFNKPDMRGRTAVGLDNMGGTDAGRLAVANTLGLGVGVETYAITIANLPPHAHPMPHSHTMAHTHEHPHTHTGPSHTHPPGTLSTDNAGTHNHESISGRTWLGTTISWLSALFVEGGGGGSAKTAGTITNETQTRVGGAHGHDVTSGATGAGGTQNTGQPSDATTGGSSAASTGGVSTPNTSNTGSGTAISLMQPSMLVNWMVKL